MTNGNIDNILNFLEEVSDINFGDVVYHIPSSYQELADKYQIPFEDYDHNRIKLKLKDYFSGENVKYAANFRQTLKSNDLNNDILLFDSNGTIIKYFAQESTYKTHGLENSTLLLDFKNLISYYSLFNFFKSDKFCDYFNDANNEIVIYSSVNGVYKIKYPTVPSVTYTEDISTKVSKLIENANQIEKSSFLKNAIFTLSKGIGSIELSDIIVHGYDVISLSIRDYDLVSKKFDFDKFRDSLYKEKEKYFNNIRDILSKIFSQAIGIPISISATVFSTYKISDDAFMLFIVMLAFITYTLFFIKIQFVYKSDIDEVELDFKKDFEIIKSKSGLSNSVIESEKVKIDRKIANSQSILNWLIIIVVILGILVCYYIFYEISKSEAVDTIKRIFHLS